MWDRSLTPPTAASNGSIGVGKFGYPTEEQFVSCGVKPQGETMTEDALKAQIAESLRFYGDMRFKQLTLFMAAMTAAGAGVMQFSLGRWWIALAALFVTAVMWVVEVRATLNAIAAHDTIPEVFPKRSAMFWLWLNSSWAVLLLHMACYVVWLYCVGSWALRGASFYIGGDWHHTRHLLDCWLLATEKVLPGSKIVSAHSSRSASNRAESLIINKGVPPWHY